MKTTSESNHVPNMERFFVDPICDSDLSPGNEPHEHGCDDEPPVSTFAGDDSLVVSVSNCRRSPQEETDRANLR